jgi:DNA-binding CsgD family transcriptional regulator
MMSRKLEAQATNETDQIGHAFSVAGNGSGCRGVSGVSTGAGMFCPPAWAAIADSLQFSGRELQLVRGVFDDQKDLALASALGISIHTIHTHFERLHHKLAVNGRPQLIQRVMQRFLALTAAPGSVLPPICACRTTGHCPRGSRLIPTPGRDPRS